MEKSLIITLLREKFTHSEMRDIYQQNKSETVHLTEALKLIVKGNWDYQSIDVTIIEDGQPDKVEHIDAGAFQFSLLPEEGRRYR